jgi:hypothetical protein
MVYIRYRPSDSARTLSTRWYTRLSYLNKLLASDYISYISLDVSKEGDDSGLEPVPEFEMVEWIRDDADGLDLGSLYMISVANYNKIFGYENGKCVLL